MVFQQQNRIFVMRKFSIVSAVSGSVSLPAGELARKYGMDPRQYRTEDGRSMNCCRREMNWDKPGKAAVVLFFHGAGERGDDNDKQLFHGAKELVGFCAENEVKALLLFPQCPAEKQWVDTPWKALSHTLPQESESMGLAMEILDYELKNPELDPSRVYVVGISMGGYGTWDALSRYPEKFAAAFPVCGGADVTLAERMKNIPILVYHGDSDAVVPTRRSRDIVEAVRKAGGTAISYVEVPDCGHDSWVAAFREEKNWRWLFAQTKKRSFLRKLLELFGL